MALSPALFDGMFEGPRGVQLYGSCFNMNWPRELGIEPKLIIDAGSYDGGDAYRFWRAFPKSLIVAIEGDPGRAVRVKENLLGLKIRVEHRALTEKFGPVEWFACTTGAYSSGSLYRLKPETGWKQRPPITVTGESLEHICVSNWLGQIDILHMDVEGATLPALRGLGPMRPRLIFTEMADCWVGAPSSEEAHAWLIGEGYREMIRTKTDRLYFREGS